MTFRIRPAEPADLDAIAQGSPRRPWTKAELAGPDGFRGVLAEHRGRVVGFWGGRVQPMNVRGDELLFCVLAGAFLEEPYRTGGLHSAFIELDETFEELCEGREAGKIACFAGRPAESDWWLLRRMRGFSPIRTETDLVLDDASSATPPPTAVRATLLDDAALRRWNSPLIVGEAAPLRDGRRMKARAGDDGAVYAVLRDERPIGAAICRPADDGGRDVVDWCAPEQEDDVAAALLAAVLDGARGAVRFPVFGRSPWNGLLQRAGFRCRPSAWGGAVEPYLACRAAHPRCDAEWLAEQWFATAADVCRLPLEACQIVEDSVFPPPPGTRAGRERHA